MAQDEDRDEWFANQGIRVLRFSDPEALLETEAVEESTGARSEVARDRQADARAVVLDVTSTGSDDADDGPSPHPPCVTAHGGLSRWERQEPALSGLARAIGLPRETATNREGAALLQTNHEGAALLQMRGVA
jgi:hypothetical protein